MTSRSELVRACWVLLPILTSTSLVAAQPSEAPPIDTPAPALPEQAPVGPPPPVLVAPPQVATPTAPPINITITNNNNDDNKNNNNNSNPVTTSTSIPVTTTVSTPVTTNVTTSVAAAPAAPATASFSQRLADCLPAGPAMHRWLLVGGIHDRHDDRHGMRATIDLLGRGPWNIGIAATFVHDVNDEGSDRDDRAGSGRVVAYVARTRRLGRLYLRGQLGLGFGGSREREDEPAAVARETMSPSATDDSDRRHGPVIEASLQVALPLRKHLGLFAGPVLAAARFDRDRSGEHEHRPDVGMVAGLMWRR